MSAQKEKRAGRFNEKRRAPPSLAGSGQTEPQCEGLTAKLAGRPLFPRKRCQRMVFSKLWQGMECNFIGWCITAFPAKGKEGCNNL